MRKGRGGRKGAGKDERCGLNDSSPPASCMLSAYVCEKERVRGLAFFSLSVCKNA